MGASGATWQDRCRASGGFATVGPRGHPLVGQPACRTGRPGAWRYSDIRTLPERTRATVRRAGEATGNVLVSTGNVADRAARSVLEAPRDAMATALGVPPQVMTVLVLGALGVAGYYVIQRAKRTGA